MHKIKNIIFDFDGVIHDTFELAYGINEKVFEEKLTYDAYRDFFNGNFFEEIEVDEDKAKKFQKLLNEAFNYLEIEKSIKENLETLSAKYPLFIISSNSETALNTYFQNNNSTHIFKEVLGMETHRSKAEKFKYVFDKYNLKFEECVFVTDTLGDILEGNKVGVKTIAVDFGFHEKERLEKGKPFKIVSSFDEIMQAIQALS